MRGVIGVGVGAGTQTVAQRERDVIAPHDVADFIEPLVKETFLVFGQAPARHDRTTARDDAGDAIGGQRHIGETDAGVDGEIIDPLLRLLDQRVLEHLPIELERVAADFLQRLIDRHRADRHRRVADDPVANIVDVAAGRQVHDGVGAPADRPHHFLDLLRHRRGDGGIADIGVHLDEKIAADDHRLQFRVIDIGRNDRASTRDFVAHKFRRYEFGDVGAKAFAVGKTRFCGVERAVAAQIFAMRDIDHFFGDNSGAGEFELRDRRGAGGAIELTLRRTGRREPFALGEAIVLRLH